MGQSSYKSKCILLLTPGGVSTNAECLFRRVYHPMLLVPNLQTLTEIELTAEFRSQGVSTVKRFTIRKDGNIIQTNTYLLTFHLSSPPDSIKAGFVSIPLQTYIPNPLRCFKCQRYGHGTSSCRSEVHCAKCGESSHDTSECNATALHCLNCKGNHAASSKDCPIWKQEKKINEIKCTQKITYQEAKKTVLAGQALKT